MTSHMTTYIDQPDGKAVGCSESKEKRRTFSHIRGVVIMLHGDVIDISCFKPRPQNSLFAFFFTSSNSL